jgi:predicted DNA-binding transcriptional regulator AlpA
MSKEFNEIVRPKQFANELGVSTVTLWNWRKKKILPEPITLGPRCIGWPRHVINRWLETQQGGSQWKS